MIHPAIAISAAVALMLFIISLPFFNFLGFKDGEKSVRTEAVERGFAEWVPDKEGNTTFKWKEAAK